MPLMTTDEIKEKAPDRRALAAARKLAKDGKWQSLGRQGEILWAVIQGCRGDEYSVHIDGSRSALECSCPSRKRPCKHALALLIYDTKNDIPDAEVPNNHKWEAEDRYYRDWE